VVSAHWETRGAPAVSLAPQPETIHDFGGFPRALFEIQYPAPGAPAAAERVAALLEANGSGRGPQRRSRPRPRRLGAAEPDVSRRRHPGHQLSIVRGASPAEHERLGRALAALRHEGVLVVASGR
jgi:4,5-DOPA dioxygenase extradiol